MKIISLEPTSERPRHSPFPYYLSPLLYFDIFLHFSSFGIKWINIIPSRRCILIFFLFISVLAFSLIVYFMPKHLTKLEMYSTSLFAAVLQLLTDIFLEFKYHLYGYFTEGVDWITLWVVFIVYPCVNIIFLNFFPSQGKFSDKGLYIAAWSAFSVAYEWIAVRTELFYYNDK
ncbi:hypothetical protein J2S09_003356 [Bacillus fengqiuensis]|nr:hypothetical protein [Bacillus fengqiuensis]